MLDILVPIYVLAIIFALVAFFYSSVGLGGGSSYTALLAIFGASTIMIPVVSLTLNLLVTTIGATVFLMNGHARLRLIAPFIISSIPAAYLGGMLELPKIIFYIILIISLLLACYRVYFPKTTQPLNFTTRERLIIAILCGGILGFIAGVTGIGGGVYLVPLIIVLGLGTAKEAAACGAFFIWVNSASGLAARVQYSSVDFYSFMPLVIAVILGSLVGSCMGAGKFKVHTMQKILGSILVVAVFLLSKKVFALVL